MSNGSIVKSSRTSAASLQVAGVVQAVLGDFFLASFLFVISRNPRLSEVIFGNISPLTTTVVLSAAFAVAGVFAGTMLLL